MFDLSVIHSYLFQINNKTLTPKFTKITWNNDVYHFSLLRLDPQNNQITPDDRLTVLCEITIDGKDVQQSGQAAGSGVSVVFPPRL